MKHRSALFAVMLASTAACISACSTTGNHETAGAYMDDSTITSKVKAKLAADDGLSAATAIHVDTYKGVVQLSGFVASRDQETKAVMLARGVAGVREVQDQIALK